MERARNEQSPSEEDRREFLKTCGRFAAVTPPAVTMLLSTSLTSNAIAASGSGGSSSGKGAEGGNNAKGGKGGNSSKGGKGGNNAKGKAKPGK
ncbi:hypothetical protein M1D34_22335 [Ensifer sp. D2-11]